MARTQPGARKHLAKYEPLAFQCLPAVLLVESRYLCQFARVEIVVVCSVSSAMSFGAWICSTVVRLLVWLDWWGLSDDFAMPMASELQACSDEILLHRACVDIGVRWYLNRQKLARFRRGRSLNCHLM